LLVQCRGKEKEMARKELGAIAAVADVREVMMLMVRDVGCHEYPRAHILLHALRIVVKDVSASTIKRYNRGSKLRTDIQFQLRE